MASFTTDDGVRLDYVQSGDPAGRPVVLIAGFKAAATSWLYQVPALEAAGYRVIAFDRRSHGTSERPATGHTMLRHGQDLDQLLTELDLHDAVLVGGSMGGNTIWSRVQQFGSDRLAGIVIVDQTPRMLNGDDWPYGFYDYDASNVDTLFAAGVPDPGRFGMTSKSPARIGRLLKALAADRSSPSRTFTPDELELLGDHARADWRSAIAAAGGPMLFVAGAQSEFWPSAHAAASAALASWGSSVVIEKDGHPANIEQPAKFNAVLLEFLAGLS